MSRFLNLESYLEYCQYTQILGESVNVFSHQGYLPIEYKKFLNKKLQQEFMDSPVLPSLLPPKLTLCQDEKISKQKLGFTIDDHSEEIIFIVRPSNFLGLNSLQASYLFSHVFDYWNFVDQVSTFPNMTKPLVIYNFDNFTPSQIIPLTFKSHPLTNYSIPLIDTRNLSDYDSLKLTFSYEEKYERILNKVAQIILKQLSLDLIFKNELTNYLKKINLFKIINSQQDNNTTFFPLIICVDNNFYHYYLNGEEFTNIISQEFLCDELYNIIDENQDKYNCLIISSYDLERINNHLFSTARVVKPNKFEQFKKVWLKARNQDFPLYGQYLDKISFFVGGKEKNQDIEIKLPEKICYQGQKEEKIYGEYFSQSQGEYRQEFKMLTPSVYLPFTINDERLIDGETHKKMMYKIENQFYDENADNTLEIKICFILQPGKTPKLEVVDQDNRVLISCLESAPSTFDNIGYISPQNIYESRQNLSKNGQENLSQNYLEIEQNLLKFNEKLAQITSLSYSSYNWIDSCRNIRSLRMKINTTLPTILDITSKENNQEHIKSILRIYKNLQEDEINTLLIKLNKQIPNNINGEKKSWVNNLYIDILLFLGKSYGLTENMSLEYLFNSDRITRQYVKSFKENLHNLARLACNIQRQKYYFNLFFSHSKKEKKPFYQIEAYLWGYARILIWYLNYEEAGEWLDYQKHFTQIINYILTLNWANNQHKSSLRNALISLIYLLTFRDKNDSFVVKDSNDYNLAKQLVKKLENEKIASNLVGTKDNITLNELFSKLLDGSANNDSIDRIITD